VIPIALDIHLAAVPIAVLGLALRAPMRPDAELRVAKPFRGLVIRQRTPIRFERPFRDGRQIQFNRLIGLRHCGRQPKANEQNAKDCLGRFHNYLFAVRTFTLNAPGTGSFETTMRYPPPQPEYITPGYWRW